MLPAHRAGDGPLKRGVVVWTAWARPSGEEFSRLPPTPSDLLVKALTSKGVRAFALLGALLDVRLHDSGPPSHGLFVIEGP